MNYESPIKNKLENIAFYIFLITFVLSPIVFWWNPFISLDLVKTFTISIGVIVSAILLLFVAMKEKTLSLPPKSLCMTSFLVIISIFVSSILSIHFTRSFFGQIFEVGNASFIILLFIAAWVGFNLVKRQKDRATVLFVGMVSAYSIIFILHFLRIVFGQNFMSLGILNTSTMTILGNWFSLSIFSVLTLIISMFGIMLLKLSRKMKWFLWILFAASSLVILLVADIRIWYTAILLFFGISVSLYIEKWNRIKNTISSKFTLIFKSIPLFPFIIFIVASLLVWKGPALLSPSINKLNIGYYENVLPWQTTLDVTSSVIQNYPLFGVGSNGFSQAYLSYKPLIINNTNAWATEFTYGFGLVPTFIASYGLVGSILWILLFVFFSIISVRILRKLPDETEKIFMVLSSFTISVFLWLVSFVSVPSHVILFFTFVFSGIFIGLATSYEIIGARVFAPAPGTKIYKVFSSLIALIILVLLVWGLVYLKKTIAFVYFGNGVKALNVSNDIEKAQSDFTKAISIDETDVYWRGQVETMILATQKLAGSLNQNSSASTTQAVLTDINKLLNNGLSYAKKAVAYDPKNYYNYVSEARISEVASSLKMEKGYENAVSAYNSAINYNPFNPALYLALASFEAKNAKYDEAIQDLGKSLQVKNNYLDAIFLLSQIYAAKGDIGSALTASKVAVQLNPQNPVLLFQLGILEYNNKDYSGASQALTEAIKYQPDYSNAKYFLGLSEARLNNTGKAIALFEELANANPDNQELALILANLRNGKSVFNDAKPPVTTAPEKRSGLPIKEKK